MPKILNSSLNALISVMLGSAGMLLIGLCAPPSASCQQSAPTAHDLSLALTAPNDVLRGGSPVEVNFVVKNITDHNVEYSCFVLIHVASRCMTRTATSRRTRSYTGDFGQGWHVRPTYLRRRFRWGGWESGSSSLARCKPTS